MGILNFTDHYRSVLYWYTLYIYMCSKVNTTVLILLARRLEILKKLTQKKSGTRVVAQLIRCLLASIRIWVWCPGTRGGAGRVSHVVVPVLGKHWQEDPWRQLAYQSEEPQVSRDSLKLAGFWGPIQGYSPYTYFMYTHVHLLISIYNYTCSCTYTCKEENILIKFEYLKFVFSQF